MVSNTEYPEGSATAFFAKHLTPGHLPPPLPTQWNLDAKQCSCCAKKIGKAARKCPRCQFTYCASCLTNQGEVGCCLMCHMESTVAANGPKIAEAAGKVTIAIVGAGIGGAMTALSLARYGFHVDVFEARESIAACTSWRGGIVLAPQPIAAIKSICAPLEACLRSSGRSCDNFFVMATHKGHPRMIGHNAPMKLRFNLPSPLQCERGSMLQAMLEECEKNPNVNLHFGAKLADIRVDDAEQRVTLKFEGEQPDHEANFVVGADGIHSRVRHTLFTKAPLRPLNNWCIVGTTTNIDFDIPMDFAMVWGKKGGWFVFIVIENADGSTTAFWAVQTKIKPPFQMTDDREVYRANVLEWAARFFPGPKCAFIMDLITGCNANTISHVLEVREAPKMRTMVTKDRRVVLLGDAMHAMSNSMGYGAGSSIEDSLVLGDVMAYKIAQSATLDRPLDVQKAMKAAMPLFEMRRVERVIAVQKGSKTLGGLIMMSFPGSNLLKYLILGRKAARDPHSERRRNTLFDFLLTYRATFEGRMFSAPLSGDQQLAVTAGEAM
jgi:2-polyprenyl-6-methoxyphenol hydroxylase-like FAD-dependent oxidoreductase